MLWRVVEPKSETRFLFVGGKGGVGKSTISAATAVRLADADRRVLLVSTDLQRSLSDILETDIGHRVRQIAGAPGLSVTETDPRALVRENWHRLAATVQDVFGPSELTELMSKEISPCAMEMASFYKLMELLTERARDYDAIVFDTAPGGRALVEITLPFTMARRYGGGDPFAEFAPAGSEARLARMAREEQRTRQTMKLITSSERTAFVYVLWPETLPIAETERALEELAQHDIDVPALVVNEVLPEAEVRRADTPYFWQRYEMQQRHLARIRETFAGKIIAEVPLLPGEVRGLALLRQVGETLYGGEAR